MHSTCDTLQCVNNGTCQALGDSVACHCHDGFEGEWLMRHNTIANLQLIRLAHTGKYCEKDIDECLSDPCANGGQCVDQLNNFTCHCPPPYYGRMCELVKDPCEDVPCHNNATCLASRDLVSYTCSCLTGYEGTFDRNKFPITNAKALSHSQGTIARPTSTIVFTTTASTAKFATIK